MINNRETKVLPCCNLKIWANHYLSIYSFGWAIFHEDGKCAGCLRTIKNKRVLGDRVEVPNVALPELRGL